MRLLVTGGAGFIGSNFIRYWLDRSPDDAKTCGALPGDGRACRKLRVRCV